MRAAGWVELHEALHAGLPHAAEIVGALDLCGYTYPRFPTFSVDSSEVTGYRLIHRAWRGGLLLRFLTALGAWRTPGSKLPPAAQRIELQQALCEFLETHRRIDPQALRSRLAEESLSTLIPTGEVPRVDTIRRRIDAIWNSRRA